MGRNKTSLATTLIVVSGIVGAAGIIRSARPAHSDTAKPLREITLTLEQQQPIKDIITEQRRCTETGQAQANGAARMLITQLKDPEGKSLDPTKWQLQNDGKDGFKVTEIPPQPVIAPPQPAPGQ